MALILAGMMRLATLSAFPATTPAQQQQQQRFEPTAELPDLLTMNDGCPVNTTAQWRQRRGELKALLQQHILGTLPIELPVLDTLTMVNTTSRGGVSSCYLRLAFQANNTGVEFEIEVAWPDGVATDGGPGLPLFLTQYNHRSWGLQGVQRGYMMVLYPGADSRDVSAAFRAAYPAASMRKILARAFVASRTLDALLVKGGVSHLPTIDPTRVAITGHSRDGKQALIAAAFDERISVVVGSSPGMPVTPVRFSSPDFNGGFTAYAAWSRRDWWLPSLRGYLGREHELPADGHMILALIAPRYAMLATARSDGESDNSFANEQSILANRPVWELLTGSSDAVQIKWREGRHHGFVDPQTYLDWFDYSATPLSSRRPGAFAAEELPHCDWNWNEWRKGSAATTPPPPVPSASLAERVKWMLGSGAATTTGGLVGGSGYCESGGVGSVGMISKCFASETRTNEQHRIN